jgi:hypothetical protein
VSRIKQSLLALGDHLLGRSSGFQLAPYPATPGARRTRNLQIQHDLAHMHFSPQDRKALQILKGLGIDNVDLWQGSHIRIYQPRSDAGHSLYARLWELGAIRRPSSHYRNVKEPQYELRFGRHGLLFGHAESPRGASQIVTFVQMERIGVTASGLALVEHPIQDLEHLLDYEEYRQTHENQGPAGSSPRTEKKDPVVIYAR